MATGYHGIVLREIGRLFGTGTVVGLSDAELLDRFAADRDEVAFAALVDRHGPMVLGLCRRIVRDVHDAEDVFQAAFLVLARKAGTIRVDDSLGRWLYTVARRLAVRVNADVVRRDKLGSGDPGSITASDDLERREHAAIVHDELDRLPTPYRHVVMLCYLEGVTHEEAARRLGWPLGSVKGRLVRAREILKVRLTRRGLALSSGTLAAALRPDPVSASLLERTLTAAIGFAASRTGLIPAVTLANGVLMTMFVSKLKLGSVAVLALCVGAMATNAGGDGPADGSRARSAAKTAPARSVGDERPKSDEDDAAEIERLVKAFANRSDDLIPKLTHKIRTLQTDLEKAKAELRMLKTADAYEQDLITKSRRRVDPESVIADDGKSRRVDDPTRIEPPVSNPSDRRPSRVDLHGRVTIRQNPPRPSDDEFSAGGVKPRVLDIEADEAVIHLDSDVLKADKPADLAREGATKLLPAYIVDPPDLLRINVLEALPGRPISGEFLVRPDGRIKLGFYGEVQVAGRTTEQIKEKVVLHLRKYLTDDALGLKKEGNKSVDPKDSNRVSVDVEAYNSKVYYVQRDFGSPACFPITGNETVLDAINFAGGISTNLTGSKIHLVRPAPPGASGGQDLPVDLVAIVRRADTSTNYQLMPGDRLLVTRIKDAVSTTDPAKPPQADKNRDMEKRIDCLIRELAELKDQIGK